VLDVAGGTENAELAAARRFGEVTYTDYVPAFLDRARQRAAAEGLPVVIQEVDAENLPYADASFDVVLSAVGAMFTPNQEQVARELMRA
jgi:ubiquinone/menaquinone biosynthesis C-methylase UbiE